MCSYVSFASAQTLKTEEVQLDSIVNELHELGEQQDPADIDYIPEDFDLDTTSEEKNCPLVNIEDSALMQIDNKDIVVPAIKFAEEFIIRVYNGDINGTETMIHPFARWLINNDCSVYRNVIEREIDRLEKLKCTSYALIDSDIEGYSVVDIIFHHYPSYKYTEPLRIRTLKNIANGIHYVLNFVYKDDAKAKYLPTDNVMVKVLPTEQLGEVENQLTSGMDALGAIRFAEKFLQATYDYDFPTMKDMICPHPDVLTFFTEDVYPVALKLRKRDGMTLNAQKGIYSKCNGIADLDITSFSETEDIPGYYKANVYFDAFPKTEEAEFVSLRVMVFQNIEDGTFSIFSIK